MRRFHNSFEQTRSSKGYSPPSSTTLIRVGFHVVLDADEDMLRQRIQDSPEAQAWRLAHLADYRASRSWMIPAADLVVGTGHQIPSAAAHQIADALPEL